MQEIKAEFNFFFFYATALLLAARGNNTKIIKLLLDNGANPDITDNSGNKPIQFLNPVNLNLFSSYIK